MAARSRASLDHPASPPAPLPAPCRQRQAQHHVKVAENQLKGYESKPDPLATKPQLEQQRADAVAAHYDAMLQLTALVRGQWAGVLQRGVAELALKEAEMQVWARVGWVLLWGCECPAGVVQLYLHQGLWPEFRGGSLSGAWALRLRDWWQACDLLAHAPPALLVTCICGPACLRVPNPQIHALENATSERKEKEKRLKEQVGGAMA